jgi:hypothetical protein
MQITINLPPDLEEELISQAEKSNISLQALILQALRQRIEIPSFSTSQWPEVILSYEGFPDFLEFESYRDELLPPCEPELL